MKEYKSRADYDANHPASFGDWIAAFGIVASIVIIGLGIGLS